MQQDLQHALQAPRTQLAVSLHVAFLIWSSPISHIHPPSALALLLPQNATRQGRVETSTKREKGERITTYRLQQQEKRNSALQAKRRRSPVLPGEQLFNPAGWPDSLEA